MKNSFFFMVKGKDPDRGYVPYLKIPIAVDKQSLKIPSQIRIWVPIIILGRPKAGRDLRLQQGRSVSFEVSFVTSLKFWGT